MKITFWSISLQQHWWFSIRNVSPDACALDINSFCYVQLRMVCPVPPLSWPGLCRRTMLFSIGPFLRKQRVKHVCLRRSYMLKSYRPLIYLKCFENLGLPILPSFNSFSFTNTISLTLDSVSSQLFRSMILIPFNCFPHHPVDCIKKHDWGRG